MGSQHRSVGFVDREKSGDCDLIDERFCRCIELVDFINQLHPGLASALPSSLNQSRAKCWRYPDLQDWVKATETENLSEREDVARMKGFCAHQSSLGRADLSME